MRKGSEECFSKLASNSKSGNTYVLAIIANFEHVYSGKKVIPIDLLAFTYSDTYLI